MVRGGHGLDQRDLPQPGQGRRAAATQRRRPDPHRQDGDRGTSMTATIKLASASLSDVGKAREINEDAQYEGEKVFAVADGLGGHRYGEVASGIAIEAIAQLDHDMTEEPADALVAAVREANKEVFERAQHEADLRGMATTI